MPEQHFYDPIDDPNNRKDDDRDSAGSTPITHDDIVGNDDMPNKILDWVRVGIINRFVRTKPVAAPRGGTDRTQVGGQGQLIVAQVVSAEPARRSIMLQNDGAVPVAFGYNNNLKWSTGFRLQPGQGVALDYSGDIFACVEVTDGTAPGFLQHSALFDDG